MPEFTAKAETKEGGTASDSEIFIEPVIWVPTVSANASIGDARFANDLTANGVISPSDLKGKLHFAACGRVEGRSGRWGGFGELFYVIASAGTTFETPARWVEHATKEGDARVGWASQASTHSGTVAHRSGQETSVAPVTPTSRRW